MLSERAACTCVFRDSILCCDPQNSSKTGTVNAIVRRMPGFSVYKKGEDGSDPDAIDARRKVYCPHASQPERCAENARNHVGSAHNATGKRWNMPTAAGFCNLASDD